ncbi:MAG TPA: hypothetical protein PKX10_09840 [Propioniciclava tarda]|nr:hypothetical protein [Propioniciclava tarda]HQA31701.1 hypothetical protein [Propioniciclava tarda]HQD61469.1 hypothetical protein [Propioniciclava tarda]
MTDADWHVALAYALVGERLDLPSRSTPDASLLADELARAGWTPERLRDHALATQASEAPWPHPVPSELRAGLGAAQFHAAVGRVRVELGLDALAARPPSGRTALTPDERRLLAEVPPHHVPH